MDLNRREDNSSCHVNYFISNYFYYETKENIQIQIRNLKYSQTKHYHSTKFRAQSTYFKQTWYFKQTLAYLDISGIFFPIALKNTPSGS